MEQLAGYRLVAVLGEGGMGRVHLARSASGRLVAVKTVHEHLAAEPEFRERFRRETVAARKVAGPFTAAVLDADPDGRRPWLATEFCAGPTLTAALAALGPLDADGLGGLGAALAEALAAVHRAGLVHRDLKPSNVVLTHEGPMLIDFGIAKAATGTGEESLTGSGEIIGSPGFIAPELLTGAGEPGPPADVFALGALLAYAGTGRAPYGTGAVHRILYRTLHDSPDLTGLPGGAAWREFLGRVLNKAPGDRPDLPAIVAWCGARSGAEPWWEREPVSGLIRRREDEIAELVTAAGAPPPASAPPPAPVPPPGSTAASATVALRPSATDPGPSPAATTALPAPSRSARPSRRRLLLWGSGLLAAGGSTAGALAAARDRARDNTRDKKKDPVTPATAHQRGTALWTKDIGGAGLLRQGDALYLVATASLSRLNARTGSTGWTCPVPDGVTDAVVGDGLIHVVRPGGLLTAGITAVDPRTGHAAWDTGLLTANPRRRSATALSPDGAGVDGTSSLLAASRDVLCLVTFAPYETAWARRVAKGVRWRAYGYDARDGAPLWFHEGTEAGVAGVHQAGGRVAVAASTGTPGSYDPKAAPATETLYVLRARDGTVEREIPGGSRHPEAHPGSTGVRYYASGGEVSRVELAPRRTDWHRAVDGESELGDTPAVTPTATAGAVYLADQAGISALDAETGRTRWSRPDLTGLGDGAPPLVAGGLVYVRGPEPGSRTSGTAPGAWGVHGLDAATGALVWAAPLDDADRGVRAVAGPGVLHLAANGTLSAFPLHEAAETPETTATTEAPATTAIPETADGDARTEAS
ncbi:PQQ-binding-like beta-propeller repeat protein [Streptomyces sp. NPDC087851]|uniref:protein kinase domain-containing protein n=1 Tax=Streptomyces sp. NPDC087851 TaxID=3365810 RepID=UPI0037FE5C13